MDLLKRDVEEIIRVRNLGVAVYRYKKPVYHTWPFTVINFGLLSFDVIHAVMSNSPLWTLFFGICAAIMAIVIFSRDRLWNRYALMRELEAIEIIASMSFEDPTAWHGVQGLWMPFDPEY